MAEVKKEKNKISKEKNITSKETKEFKFSSFNKMWILLNEGLFILKIIRKRIIPFLIVIALSFIKLIFSIIYQVSIVPKSLYEQNNFNTIHKIIFDISDYILVISVIMYLFVFLYGRIKIKKINFYKMEGITKSKKIVNFTRPLLISIISIKLCAMFTFFVILFGFSAYSFNDIFSWPVLSSTVVIFFIIMLFTIYAFYNVITLRKEMHKWRDVEIKRSSTKISAKETPEVFNKYMIYHIYKKILFSINNLKDSEKETVYVSQMAVSFYIKELYFLTGLKKYVYDNLSLVGTYKWNIKYIQEGFKVGNKGPIGIGLAKKIHEINPELLSKKDVENLSKIKEFNTSIYLYSQELKKVNHSELNKTFKKAVSEILDVENIDQYSSNYIMEYVACHDKEFSNNFLRTMQLKNKEIKIDNENIRNAMVLTRMVPIKSKKVVKI